MTERYTQAELFARIEGLTVTRLRHYTAVRCVRPVVQDGRPTYLEEDVARLRLLCELAADFDMDEEASVLVLSLLDQIHGLRAELRSIAGAVAEEPVDIRRRIAARAAAARSGDGAGG
jgi:chaperone modulatory protein CbpM